MAEACYNLDNQNQNKYIALNFDAINIPDDIKNWRVGFTGLHTKIAILSGYYEHHPEDFYEYWYYWPSIIKENLKFECDSLLNLWMPQFEFGIETILLAGNPKSTRVIVNVTSLASFEESDSLKVYIFFREEDRKIVRSVMPRSGNKFGFALGKINSGNSKDVTVEFTVGVDGDVNDYTKIRVLCIVQSSVTKKILGTFISNNHPFITTSTKLESNSVVPDETKLIISNIQNRLLITSEIPVEISRLVSISGRKILLDRVGERRWKTYSTITNGIYFLRIDNNESRTQKIIIK